MISPYFGEDTERYGVLIIEFVTSYGGHTATPTFGNGAFRTVRERKVIHKIRFLVADPKSATSMCYAAPVKSLSGAILGHLSGMPMPVSNEIEDAKGRLWVVESYNWEGKSDGSVQGDITLSAPESSLRETDMDVGEVKELEVPKASSKRRGIRDTGEWKCT